MYKVFVNDKPIIFTTSLKNEGDYPVYTYKNIVIEEVIYRLKVGKLKGGYLFSNDLESDWNHFLKSYKLITAAGGLVLNPKKEILFIFRGNRWDLPKGRIEEGESIEDTAVREVEEECGIQNLVIEKFLVKTYHIFFWKTETRIKETYWYLMHSDYSDELTPQVEEGITEAVFKNEKETEYALKNGYSNIRLVHQAFLG